jgi:hypothetical protein
MRSDPPSWLGSDIETRRSLRAEAGSDRSEAAMPKASAACLSHEISYGRYRVADFNQTTCGFD